MKILFLGDLFFDYDMIPSDLNKLCDYIKENDLKVILNLEGALVKKENPIKKRGTNLMNNGKVIEVLKKMNVIAVCLANNHTMDFGGKTLLEELRLLDEAGIKYVGAGQSKNAAVSPLRLVFPDSTLNIQNYGWDIEETVYANGNNSGCAGLIFNEVLDRTKQLRKKYPNEVLINCFHWGFEFNTYPMPRDIKFAHECIEAGCDIIIGHHPHVPQAHELFKEKHIYYSLGNFYFGSRRQLYNKCFPYDKHSNMCDYGLGVIFDTVTMKTTEIGVFYDHNTNTTVFNEQVDFFVDISNSAYDSSEYYHIVKKHSENINPILGLDEKKNQALLSSLNRKYWIASRIRFIKKNRIGRFIFDTIKRIAH